MPLLAAGDYRPDVSDYEGQATRNILNVIPRGDGYGPFPAFSAYTSALASACRGAFYALKSDGTVITFAGTSTKLYKLNNTDFTWTDVSKGASTYSALSSTAQWQFAQTGNLVFATQANAVLQVFDLSSGHRLFRRPGLAASGGPTSAWSEASSFSPACSRRRFASSGRGLDDFNASDSWTSGLNSSDFQDFPDGRVGPRRRWRLAIRHHIPGSGHSLDGLCRGLTGHLPDRSHFAGQGIAGAVLDHPGR